MRKLKLTSSFALFFIILFFGDYGDCRGFGKPAGRRGEGRYYAKISRRAEERPGTEFQGVHDHIYVRAIALDNGLTDAALISIDVVAFPDSLELRRRMEKETGIPAEHIFITATHDHNAPVAADPRETRGQGPETVAYTAAMQSALLEAVRQANANLQPGKIGLATGRADINVNRDEFVGRPVEDRPRSLPSVR